MVEADEKWFKRFITIWTGQASSLIGSQLAQFALVWYLTIQTGSATVLAIASIAAILPQIFLTPIAGAYVDRWRRRHVMIVADVLIALCTFVLIILFTLGYVEIWHIFVALFARSCCTAFHWPAQQAATTMLVPEKHLTRVAGMNQTMQGFSNILAPPMAAVLIAFMPIQQVLVFDILAVSIAITILLFIKFPEPAPKTGPRQKVIADMKEAFAYLRGWHGALTMMCMFMAINMLITPAFNLMSILVRNTFNGGAIDFATLEAAAGIGMISGGLALSIWGGTKRKIVTIMSATILAGVGITLMTLVPHNGFLLMVGLVFFVGIVMVMLNGSLMSLLQSCIPKGIQGRVLSLMGSISVGAAPIGMVFAGPITDGMGIQFWFLIAGISTALIGLTAFFLPSVMRIEDPSSQPEYSEKTPEAQISPETDV